MATFEACEVALDLVRVMRGVVEAVGRHDRDLAIQMRRATSSVPLNIAEGSQRAGKDRLHPYRVAAGSATEVASTLRIGPAGALEHWVEKGYSLYFPPLLGGMVSLVSLLAVAQRTSVSNLYPIYANGGKPDLVVDPKRFVSQMEIVDRVFAEGDCALAEGVVGGAGVRRLLRFDTVVMNMGDGDLVVGDRSDPNNPYARYFVFHACHGHCHIQNFSIYELRTLDGKKVVAKATKQGFCFEDSLKYGDRPSNGYDCSYQGITTGWGDWYYKQLVGQWIDITGVPEGEYTVRVSINIGRIFDEGENRYANVLETRVRVPDPRHKVAIAE